MSNAMQNLCRPLQLPATEKAVLMCLADGASDNGHVFMLVSTLMLFTCLGERTVRRAVASLDERGYVRLELRQGRSSVYWLIPEAIDAGIDPMHRRSLTPATQAPPRSPTPACQAPTPACQAGTPACQAPITMSEPEQNLRTSVRVSQTDHGNGFDFVWKAYPRKTCKAEARKEWDKVGGGEALTGRMLAWIAAQQQTDQWQRGVVPHLRTVLHQKRFEDPLPGDAGQGDQLQGHRCVVCGAAATILFENRRYCREHNAARM